MGTTLQVWAGRVPRDGTTGRLLGSGSVNSSVAADAEGALVHYGLLSPSSGPGAEGPSNGSGLVEVTQLPAIIGLIETHLDALPPQVPWEGLVDGLREAEWLGVDAALSWG